MFFKASNFRKGFDERSSILAAQIANEIINEQGSVLYGNKFADTTLDNFSSTKEQKDTHVGIIIGTDEMGLFADDRTIHTGNVDQDDLLKATQDRNAVLDRENKSLRDKGTS